MNDRAYQLVGLGGFMISGVVFLVAGIQTTDALTMIAALPWLLAWGVPVWRTDSPRTSELNEQRES